MKSIFYAPLGLVFYLMAGVGFWGNHYLMLPLFLLLISATSYAINRKKSLDLVRKNMFWTLMPFAVFLIVGGLIANPYSWGLILAYVTTSIIALLGVYYLISYQQSLHRVV